MGKRFLSLLFVAGSLTLSLGACSSMADLDRARLNHAGMDITNARQAPLYPYSSLGGVRDSAQSGGCAVCAK